MPKKTKDLKLEETKQTNKKSVSAKKTSTAKKKTTAKKADVSKKKTTAKKTDVVKKSIAKKTSLTKKQASAKTTTTRKKSSVANKVASKKNVSKKATSHAKEKKATTTKKFQAEYYDLPFYYNKTVVKVLAQTPKMLFIYWEIAEADRKKLQKQFGENFFETTRPVLIVFNDTMHYSFEVDINDFANSWYLHIDDANCDYHIELGRRPILYNSDSSQESSTYIPYYVYLTSSNEMVAPNNKILFDPSVKTVRFKNVKTGQVTDKDINQFTFITNFGIFNLQDLYKYLYPNESFEFENIVLGNTSSGALSSSGMFSSQFK